MSLWRFPCPCLPSYHRSTGFEWVPGIQSQVLTLMHQVLSSQSCLHSLKNYVWLMTGSYVNWQNQTENLFGYFL